MGFVRELTWVKQEAILRSRDVPFARAVHLAHADAMHRFDRDALALADRATEDGNQEPDEPVMTSLGSRG